MKKLLSTILALSMLLTCVFNFTVSAESESIISSITAENGTVTVEFTEDVTFPENLEGAVTVSLNDDSVNFEAKNEAGKLVITIDGEIQYNVEYSLTLTEDFTDDEAIYASFTFVKAEFADFYAGVGSITVEYTADIPADGVGEISLTDESGAAVPFTSSTKGKVLTIVPQEKLVRDTMDYCLTVGGVEKNFKIKTVWEPEIDMTAGTVKGLNVVSGDGTLLMQPLDDNSFIYAKNWGMAIPDIDTNKEEYKNASFSFDMKAPYTHAYAIMGFNMDKNNPSGYSLYDSYHKKIFGVDFFAWADRTQGTAACTQGRVYRIDSLSTAEVQDSEKNITTEGNYLNNIGLTPDEPENKVLNWNTVKLNKYKTTELLFATASTDGTDSTATVMAAPYQHYSIDKVGSLGTLTVNGQLADRYDTSACYPSGSTARETGYFFLNVNASFPMIFSDMAITVCETVAGEATKTDISEIYAGTGSVTVKYATDIENVFDIGKVTLTKADGTKIGTEQYSKGNILTIVPNETLVRDDEVYTLKIGGKTRSFKLKTIWEMDQTSYESAKNSFTLANNGGLATYLTDNNWFVVMTGNNAIYPNVSAAVSEYKNASFSFDVKYPASFANTVYGFNSSGNTGGAIAYGPGAANLDTTRASKTVYMWSVNNRYSSNPIFARQYWDAATGNWHINDNGKSDYIQTDYEVGEVTSAAYKNGNWYKSVSQTKDEGNHKITFNTLKKENGDVDGNAFEAVPTYHYSIDKLGSWGTFIIDNTLIDRFNAADESYGGATAAETGYFVIGTKEGVPAFNNMAITVCEFVPLAEPTVTEIKDFYAGTGSITVKYENDFELFEVGAISLKDKNGADVAFTTSVKDKTLTIVPGKKLARDAAYTLTIGKTEKRFMLKTVWEPKTDYEKGTVTGLNMVTWSAAKDHKIAVTKDGDIGVFGAADTLYPNTEKLENASFSYDIIYMSSYSNSVVGFNAQSNAGGMAYPDDSTRKTAYMWNTNNQTSDQSEPHMRMWRNDTEINMSKDKREKPETKLSMLAMNWAEDITYTAVTEGEGEEQKIIGYTADYGEHDLSQATKYSYSIDKLGTLGTLVVDGQLVDRFDTKAVDANAPTSGYFLFGLNSNVVLSNMAITVCVDPDALEDDLVKVTQATCTAGANNTLSGTVTVANTYSVEKPVTVVVAAYKGTTLLDFDLVTLTGVTGNKLATHGTASGTYSLEGTAGYDKVKVLVWDSLDSMSPWDCHIIN